MALTTLPTGAFATGSVGTGQLADGAVTTEKMKADVNFRNIIINGDMSIAQRGTSSTGITSNGYYTVDRFEHAINYGTYSHAQSTDVPTGQGFANSFKLDCTTSGTPSAGHTLMFRQKFEGQNLQNLKKGTSSAESLTLSFWVKSNKTGTYITELFDVDNQRQISKSYTINSSDTWEKKIINFDGDTSGTLGNDNGNSMQLSFWLGAGTQYTSGTLSTTWTSNTNANRAVGQVNFADSTSNEWYITGVQLEVGTSASDFEFLPHDVNLMRCYRYCVNVIKGNQEDGPANEPIAIGKIGNTDEFAAIIRLPTEMRANPSVVTNSISGNFYIGAGGNGGLVDSIGSGESLRQTIELYKASTGHSLTQGYAATILTANSNSILRAEAEL